MPGRPIRSHTIYELVIENRMNYSYLKLCPQPYAIQKSCRPKGANATIALGEKKTNIIFDSFHNHRLMSSLDHCRKMCLLLPGSTGRLSLRWTSDEVLRAFCCWTKSSDVWREQCTLMLSPLSSPKLPWISVYGMMEVQVQCVSDPFCQD